MAASQSFIDAQQAMPAAGALADLYTVPASTQAVVSTLIACNQAPYAAQIRVSVAVAGAADAAKQYLYYDVPVPAKRSHTITLGITLAAGSVVRVRSDNGLTSFNLFGSQVS